MQSNAIGVLRMQLHDYRGALQSFGRAIGALRVGLEDEGGEDSLGTTLLVIGTNNRKEQWHPIQIIAWLGASKEHGSNDSPRNDSSYLIRQALTLKEAQDNAQNHCNSTELLTVILYNQGLANHLIGIQERGSKESLRRALCFYDLALGALEILHQGAEGEGTEGGNNANNVTPPPAQSMTTLALLNNKGHAQHEMGYHHDAHKTFALLLEAFGTMQGIEGSGSSQQHSLLDAKACCGLLLNLYMFSKKPLSAPAA